MSVLSTHLCRKNSSISSFWTGPFQVEGISGKFLSIQSFIGVHVLNASSVDPDQTPISATSDLCLYCLLMSHFGNAGHKWVESKYVYADLFAI